MGREETYMKNWKLIIWGVIGLVAILTLPLLYILVAIQLDPEPDSFDRDVGTPFGGGLGQITTPWKELESWPGLRR